MTRGLNNYDSGGREEGGCNGVTSLQSTVHGDCDVVHLGWVYLDLGEFATAAMSCLLWNA